MFLGPLIIAGSFAVLTASLSKSSLEANNLSPKLAGYDQNKVIAFGGLAGSVFLTAISPPLAIAAGILGGSALAAELLRLQVKDGLDRNLWQAQLHQAQIEQAQQAPTLPPAPPPAAPTDRPGWFDRLLSPFFDAPST